MKEEENSNNSKDTEIKDNYTKDKQHIGNDHLIFNLIFKSLFFNYMEKSIPLLINNPAFCKIN
jgi:hypothetical protein